MSCLQTQKYLCTDMHIHIYIYHDIHIHTCVLYPYIYIHMYIYFYIFLRINCECALRIDFCLKTQSGLGYPKHAGGYYVHAQRRECSPDAVVRQGRVVSERFSPQLLGQPSGQWSSSGGRAER